MLLYRWRSTAVNPVLRLRRQAADISQQQAANKNSRKTLKQKGHRTKDTDFVH
jgi:hypothetical protein